MVYRMDNCSCCLSFYLDFGSPQSEQERREEVWDGAADGGVWTGTVLF
jgi:hypothetical protein